MIQDHEWVPKIKEETIKRDISEIREAMRKPLSQDDLDLCQKLDSQFLALPDHQKKMIKVAVSGKAFRILDVDLPHDMKATIPATQSKLNAYYSGAHFNMGGINFPRTVGLIWALKK